MSKTLTEKVTTIFKKEKLIDQIAALNDLKQLVAEEIQEKINYYNEEAQNLESVKNDILR